MLLVQKFWLLVCAALVTLSGCGGGGGGDPQPPVVEGFTQCNLISVGVCSGFTGKLDWDSGGSPGDGPGAGGDGSGGAAAGGDLGQFRGALVKAFQIDGTPLGGGNNSALTDSLTGMVTIKVGEYRGPLVIELHGQPNALYFDEGKNTFTPFPPGQLLRTVVPGVTSNIGITPFTEAAYRLLTEGSTPERAGTAPTVEQIDAANKKVRDIINGQFPSSVQIESLTRLPLVKSDTTPPGSAGLDKRGTYGLITGAFSKQAAMFNPTEAAPTLAATRQLSNDLLDGHLDGSNSGQPIAEAGKRTYDPHSLVGELSSALAQQTERFGNAAANDVMPAVTNFGNTRYQSYLFDAKLTPAGKAAVTVAGWEGANEKNRSTGEERPLLPGTARVQSLHGNTGHGALFIKSDSPDSTSKVYAVGDNTNGELGNGNRNPTTAETGAVEIPLPGPVTHIVGGFAHTVARLADGSVYAWGDNSYAQLGQGQPPAQLPRSTTPLRVTLPRGAIAVAASNVASYALLEDGSVYSWGTSWGFGLLGDGNKEGQRLAPAAVLSTSGALSGIVQISARDNDVVVLDRNGTVLTWGSFPTTTTGGFSGGRQVATPVAGLPAPAETRIRKVLTEQGLFIAQAVTGEVFHWGVHFDLTADGILYDVTAVRVLNLPLVRDVMPGGYIGYGQRPFDRVTGLGVDPNGGFWKIRGRVAERFDPADPTAQRRPRSQGRSDQCDSCHTTLTTWPVKAPPVTSTATCNLPVWKTNTVPPLINSSTDCAMCHNPSGKGRANGFLNCVVTPPLAAPIAPTVPEIFTAACQLPNVHVTTPPGTVCASCHNGVIAQPLACLDKADPLAPSTRALISSASDDSPPSTGTIANGGITNDLTPTITGTLSAALVAGQTVQVLRNDVVIASPTVSGLTWSLVDTLSTDGSYRYNARVVQSGRNGALSVGYTVNVDRTNPVATITALNVVSDAGPVASQGVIASGGTTVDTTPILRGTLSAALAAGESVEILRGGVSQGLATISGGTNFEYQSAALANATFVFTAQIVDRAGNSDARASRASTVTVNSTPTISPSITVRIDDFTESVGSVTGPRPSGSPTDSPTPTLRGTLVGRTLGSGESVRVYYQAGQSTVSATATVSGTSWSFVPPALADGTYTFSSQVINTANQTSALSNSFVITVDRTPPSVAVDRVEGRGVTAPFTNRSITTNSLWNDNSPQINIGLSAPLGDNTVRIVRSIGNTSAVISRTIVAEGTTGRSFYFVDGPLVSNFLEAQIPTPVAAPNPPTAQRYTGPAAPPSAYAGTVIDYSISLVDPAGNVGSARSLRFTLNYPVCDRTRVSNHTTSTNCSSCHRSDNGYVIAPPTSTLAANLYWCRIP